MSDERPITSSCSRRIRRRPQSAIQPRIGSSAGQPAGTPRELVSSAPPNDCVDKTGPSGLFGAMTRRPALALVGLLSLASPVGRAGRKRNRCPHRSRRPTHRDDRVDARQSLHRHGNRARSRAHRGTLRGAARDLSRVPARYHSAGAAAQKRRGPSALQSEGLRVGPRHGRCRAAQDRRCIAGRDSSAAIATPSTVAPGDRFVIAGYGSTVADSDTGQGTPRAAVLVATGKPGTLQIRLVDPDMRGERAGLGACTGDSGGPAFINNSGSYSVIGVVSWSTGPANSAGCGGLTGVTPLASAADGSWSRRTRSNGSAP